jgi:hypothetical protein
MSRDILSEYGPERSVGPKSGCGGVESFKPLPYSSPAGPKNMGRGPGANATIHKSGSQGSHGISESESGHSGIEGDRHPHGSQR